MAFLQFQKCVSNVKCCYEKKLVMQMSLQTVMNLNCVVMLVSVIHTDEGVQSRLSKEHKSSAPSLPRRDK